jgi:hypothetical protein
METNGGGALAAQDLEPRSVDEYWGHIDARKALIQAELERQVRDALREADPNILVGLLGNKYAQNVEGGVRLGFKDGLGFEVTVKAIYEPEGR